MLDKKQLNREFQRDWKKHYALNVFEEKGFNRKQCRKCKKFFWTTDAKRKLCGDSACEPYLFIGKKLYNKFDYTDTWQEFSRYFTNKKYTNISRYPTIARWRDDTWFVQASIYDFQPFVVSGEVRPPANPLVVAQPCFRFNDIENIGLTSRHYSGFVMIGQHRFIPAKAAHLTHWKDEDIGNAIGVLEYLGINRKDVTFVESVWMGGGNAGSSFEVYCRGLEIATTVFMEFAVTPSGLKDLPLKVIDFGWGLERLAWLLNGTTNSYEITFDPVDKKWLKQLKIKFDDKLQKKLTSVVGALNIEDIDNIDDELKKISRKLKIAPDKLKNEIDKMRAFYSILDHSKTLLFALADGALPSNTGGGYNLRFILRRALRLAEKFGWQIDLTELVRDHARALTGARPRQVKSVKGEELSEVGLKPLFPELMDFLPDVEKILNIEVQKYKETKQKISQALDNMFKKKKTVSGEELVQLYDAQGILPEDVQATAEKVGVTVKIPQDFYSRVASLHVEPKKALAKVQFISELAGVPATQALYYNDECVQEFTARVLKVINNTYVVLDKTTFYPVGGGQACDLGTINGKPVVSVEKYGNVILHEMPEVNFREGQVIIGKIDMGRRIALMAHHDAAHIINGIAHAVLGHHVWQAGSDLTPEKGRLDITHFSTLTKDDLQKIERLANEVALSSTPIKKTVMPKAQAEQAHGFRLYQGGAVPGAEIRVIEIPGVDVEACGGTHSKSTASVGFIKILGSKKIQDGIVRIEFVAGKPAVVELQKIDSYMHDASVVFSVQPDQLTKTCERFFKEWKEQKKEIERLKSQGKPQQPQKHGQQIKQEPKKKGSS